MTLNGKTKAIMATATAALIAALASGFTVHLAYRGMVHKEGVAVGTATEKLDSLDERMTTHVAMCDERMNDVTKELGKISGTVDAIWRHMKNHDGQRYGGR